MHPDVCISSDAELEAYVAPLRPKLALAETENSWAKIDAALVQLRVITKSGGARVPSYVDIIREVAPCITQSLLSERTKLSGTASDVLNSMAPRLGEQFASLLPVFMPPLLQLCSRTNKVALKRAEKSIHLICRHCQLVQTVPYLVHALHDKAPALRVVALGALVELVDASGAERLQKRVGDIEQVVRKYARDANSEVRAMCRTLYVQFSSHWPERMELFSAQLSPTSQRYLGNQAPRRTPTPEPTRLRSAAGHGPSRTASVYPTRSVTRDPYPVVSRSAPKQTMRTVTRVQRTPSQPTSTQSTPSTRSEPDVDVFTSPSTLASSTRSASPPVADMLPTPPRRFAAPSEGVAYRLALAKEHARARTQNGEPRIRSRALLPSATCGGARRVQIAKPEGSATHWAPVRTAPVEPATLRTTATFMHGNRPPASPAAGVEEGSKPCTPAASPERAQFTPKRRPFGVVNDARTQSPHVNQIVQ